MIDQLRTVSGRDVSRETVARVERYCGMVEAETRQQNLVARSTLGDFWTRHIFDSAQLCAYAQPGSRWLDIGSGAGLPGVVIALLTNDPVTLVEPRKLRAAFLQRCVDELALDAVEVIPAKVEKLDERFDAITARAVASIDVLLGLSHRLSHAKTRWILPKGRSGAIELAEAKHNWQGRFRTVPSVTDEEAVIVLAEGIEPAHGPRGRAQR